MASYATLNNQVSFSLFKVVWFLSALPHALKYVAVALIIT